MSQIHPRLLQIIDYRLKSALKNFNYHPHGKDLWIIDLENENWIFIVSAEGVLKYNQKFFNTLFALFSMRENDFKQILKNWFEKTFEIPIREMQREASNFSYLMDIVLRKNKDEKDWMLSKRFGFSYSLVKKYVDMKKNLKTNNLKVENFLK